MLEVILLVALIVGGLLGILWLVWLLDAIGDQILTARVYCNEQYRLILAEIELIDASLKSIEDRIKKQYEAGLDDLAASMREEQYEKDSTPQGD